MQYSMYVKKDLDKWNIRHWKEYYSYTWILQMYLMYLHFGSSFGWTGRHFAELDDPGMYLETLATTHVSFLEGT